MARFVHIGAEYYKGMTYWGPIEYYEAGPSHVHVTDYMRDYADYVHPEAETSQQGVYVHTSGEHGGIWFPCPDDVLFFSRGPVLASIKKYGSMRDVDLRPTLGFFFSAVGGVFPIDRGDMMAALSHKIPLRPASSLSEAMETVREHAKAYYETKRLMPYFR